MKELEACPTGKFPIDPQRGMTVKTEGYKCPIWDRWYKDLPVETSMKKARAAFKHASCIVVNDRVYIGGKFTRVMSTTKYQDDFVEIEVEGWLGPRMFHKSTPVLIDTASAKRHDDQLSADLKASQADDIDHRMDEDWGSQAFNWMQGAIRMLKNREWAEQMPLGNAMLCDLETQISELVGLSTRYTEVQHKFAAAVRTLESLGYEYRSEGAEQWAPTRWATPPDYIKWEKGLISGLPPVGAQITYEWGNGNKISNGKVVGVGSQNMIVARYSGEEGETEEEVLELCEVIFWPYSEADHNRAQELTEALRSEGQRMNSNAVYSMILRLIKAGKI